MAKQLGFGWGKGRRVIKTIIAGEALTRALVKQQTWVDRHRALVEELQDTLVLEHATHPEVLHAIPNVSSGFSPRGVCEHSRKLRMAKARLRSSAEHPDRPSTPGPGSGPGGTGA